MSTYSEVSDLLLGDIPIPKDAMKWVQDATDEIDSKLGQRYLTPIIINDSVPGNRSTTLLLKRIANWLASGRIILAKAASASQQETNQYGLMLIKEATSALDSISSGAITLPGASFVNSEDVGESGPIINNLDATSNVESFYGFVTTPSVFGPCDPPWQIWPDGRGF